MTSSAGTIDWLRPRIAALVRRYRYAAAALDQIALSLFAFVLNLCLVRILSPTDFGVVSLWLSVSLLMIGVQNALVNGPLSIYLPAARDPAAAQRLETALALVNVATIAVTAIAVGVVNVAAAADWAREDVWTVLAIPLFIALGLYREYYRSVAFSRRDMAMLWWIDAPYLAATSLCLAGMFVYPARFGGLASAFLAMSIGCAASQLCLRWRRIHTAPVRCNRAAIAAYRGIAREVGWSLVGVFANHVETRSYAYIATSLVGLAAFAAINIVGVLFRPVTVLMNAWAKTALPQLSGTLAHGETAAFDRVLWRALAVAAAGSIGWYVALAALWDPVERFLLAGKYPEARLLLLSWAVASAAMLLRSIAGLGLIAAREFKFLAHAQIVCGALAAAATIAMILWLGYTGTMWGIALGNAACLGWILVRLRRVRRPGFLDTLPQWEGAGASTSPKTEL